MINFDELVTKCIKDCQYDNIYIKINNKEELEQLLNELHTRGYKWNSEDSLLDKIVVPDSATAIVVYVDEGRICWASSIPLNDEYVVNFESLKFDFKDNKEPTIYISGAISGTDDYMERFEKAETELETIGYTVINPAKINSFLPITTTWEQYMEIDYKLLDICDYIYMTKGWQNSKGANAELEYAKEHNIKIIYESEKVLKCDNGLSFIYDDEDKDMYILYNGKKMYMNKGDVKALNRWLFKVL